MSQPPPSLHLVECIEVGRELPPPSGRPLLSKISFGVARGEVLGIVGPSGAGKSSLLRLINRLDELTSGSVLLDGVSIRNLAPRELRRRVGMVMQRAFLFPGTVGENISFGPAQRGETVSENEIEKALARVGLSGYANRSVANLSGGEAQRVAVTRALMNRPEVLLLDEPTSALDEKSKHGVEELLAELIRERGLTCLWVTHDLAQARAHADKLLVLRAGEVMAHDRPEAILDLQD